MPGNWRRLDHRFNYLTFDIIGAMAFSQSFGFLRHRKDSRIIKEKDIGRDSEIPSVIDALIYGLRLNITAAQISTSLAIIKAIITIVNSIAPLSRLLGANNSFNFDAVCMQHLQHRLDKSTSPSVDDFMQSILTDRNGEEHKVPLMELFAESGVIIGAGSATITGALSSSFYFLASHPRCFARLRAEVDSAISYTTGENSDLDNEIAAYDLIKNPPYLCAVIDETLRLRPPISFVLPRRVFSPEGAVVTGFHIRERTVVAVPPYTIHRKASLYTDPEAFKPERWIREEGDLDPEKEREIDNLKAYTISFSQGSRACIGRHIAVVEVHILLATMVRRYDIGFAEKG